MNEAMVLVEVDGPIGTLTLNRPDRLNSFVGEMRDEIGAGLVELGGREDVRVVVVTGAGRAFCAGADVRYLAELLERGDIEEASLLVAAGGTVVRTIRSMPKPVIASLNGPAAGGGANLALACDLRIASDRATIGQTFNRIGLHPDWGGSYLLPRLVGPARAAELVFLADMIDAQEAERIGLFNRVVPHDTLGAVTRETAERLAVKPALALRLAKESLVASLSSSLEEMLARELKAQRACFESADALEGVRSFVEKRPARFGQDT
ncbi:MAG: enoyl-CoA hydratase-related protein [Gemmatimonadota bacterium]